MPNGSGEKITRRIVAGAGAGLALGLLTAQRFDGTAQDATPASDPASPAAGPTPRGFVTMRMRPIDDPEFRDDMNARVIEEFLPKIASVDGFEGYLVGDVIEDPSLTFGITVMRDKAAADRSDEVVKDFVFQDDIDKHVVIEETRRWTGDLLILGKTAQASASPATPPLDEFGAGYFITVRIYASLPGTDPREFVPLAISEFLPIILDLPGFVGYLWFPVDGGFISVSLYDSEASAIESTDAAKIWVTEHLASYTAGNPEVINATVAYANMPIFA